MYNSAFYKLSAREALKNNYWAVLICAIVCVVPTYFSTKLGLAAVSFGLIPDWCVRILDAVVQIFVINILMVGFIRFLIKLAPREESSLSGYDYNLVFSGYKENFPGTLAATFMRQLRIFLWSVLAAVILLLAGLCAWASVGTLETVADVTVIVSGSDAQVFSAGAHPIAKGMALRVAGEESVILSTASDGYGRITGRAEMDLPDGSYSGQLVVDSTRPIDFLLKSR